MEEWMSVLTRMIILVAGFLPLAFFPAGGFAQSPPVSAFARMAQLQKLCLTPDGKYLAGELNHEDQAFFATFTIEGGKMNYKHLRKIGRYRVNWCRWATSGRVLVSVGFTTHRRGAHALETRLLAMNVDGEKYREMGSNAIIRDRFVPQIHDQVVDVLPNDPDHILMSYLMPVNPVHTKVCRVNILSGHRKSAVKTLTGACYKWMTDRTGAVRLTLRVKDGRYSFMAGGPDEKDWEELMGYEAGSGTVFDPLGFTSDPNVFLVASNHEDGQVGLYEYRVDQKTFGKTRFKHPDTEFKTLGLNPKTWALRFVAFREDGALKHQWMEKESLGEIQSIVDQYAGLDVHFVKTSANDAFWLLYVDADNHPGGYMLFDREKPRIYAVAESYPELAGVAFGKRHPFGFHAKDGLRIPAAVTLPPGIKDLSQAKNLPLVVMPHGDPTACGDFMTFAPCTQFLASRGYAVLEIHPRGAHGYGAALESAGPGQWGHKMQDDVTQGVLRAIKTGLADKKRIAIMGWAGVGGYAAMMGAVKTPDLYQCAIGVNGIYDLLRYMKSRQSYVGRGAAFKKRVPNYKDERISPENRVDEIKCPVLLAASSDDHWVPVWQSRGMKKALKRADKKVACLEFRRGKITLEDPESRLEFFTALESFLEKHM
jgi:pimeloyl-ACP methyl ester carboxylesterase